MAGPLAQSFALLGKVESVENTAPSGNWAKLPCYRFDMSDQQEYEEDPVLSLGLGRHHTDPSLGPLNIPGTAEIPFDTGNLDFWFDGLFGDGTDSGSGPTITTWKPASALSSFAFEKGFTDAAKYWVYTGVKMNTLGLSVSPDGPARFAIGMIGRGGSADTSSGGGTPTTATFGRVMNRWCSIAVGGSAPSKGISAELSYTNNLDAYRTVRNDPTGAVSDIDPGMVGISGNITLRSVDTTAHAAAIAGTPVAIAFTFTLANADTITFTVPRAFLGRPSIPVAGPGGIQQTYPFRGAYDASSSTSFSVARSVA